MSGYCIIDGKRMYGISKFCTVCGSVKDIRNKDGYGFLCGRHRCQIEKHNRIFIGSKDYSRIEIFEKYAMVELYDINRQVVDFALIDKEDVAKVSKHKWWMNDGYATTKLNNSSVYMHNIILKTKDIADHINRNRLDNRRDNLRNVSRSENMMNSKLSKRNRSGVKGVTYDKARGKWMAQIRANKKSYALGRFEMFDDAVKIRLVAETKYFGVFSKKYVEDYNAIQLQYLSHDDNKQTYIEVGMDGSIIKFKKPAS